MECLYDLFLHKSSKYMKHYCKIKISSSSSSCTTLNENELVIGIGTS